MLSRCSCRLWRMRAFAVRGRVCRSPLCVPIDRLARTPPPAAATQQQSQAAIASGVGVGGGGVAVDDYTSATQRAARSAMLLRPSSSAAEGAGSANDALDDDADDAASIGRFGDSAAQFGAADPASSGPASTVAAAPPSQFRAFSSTQPIPAPSSSASKHPFRQTSTMMAGPSGSDADDAGLGLDHAAGGAAVAGSSSSGSSADYPAQMHSVRHLHSSVQSTLGSIQSKTSGILIAQERDLLRSFRDRLASISEELQIERKKNESGSAEWVSRCRKLTGELDFVRELTESLSTENKTLLSENRRAARLASTQEADRSFLIKQLVAVKKENARLRFMVEQQIKENAELQQQQGGGHAQIMPPNNALSPTPPATGNSGLGLLTQHALAAHNNHSGGGGGGGSTPRMKFQSIHNPPTHGAGSAQHHAAMVSPRSQSSQHSHAHAQANLFPQAPANMRAAILAAATTESGFNERAAVGSNFLAASASAAAQASGSKSARGGASPSALQPHQQLLPESRLASGQEARLKSVISTLKRKLDQECSAHRAARAAYIAEVQGRTQLQHLFKNCVDAVKAQVADRKNQAEQTRVQAHLALRSPRGNITSSGGGASNLSPSTASIPLSSPPPLDPRSLSLDELTEGDKVALVSWMLGEPAVMNLLFDRIWPVHPPAAQGSAGAGWSAEQSTFNAMPLHYSYGAFIPPSAGKHTQQQQQYPQPNQSQLQGTHEITPSLRARMGMASRTRGGGGGRFDDEDDGAHGRLHEEEDDGAVTHSPLASPRAQEREQEQNQHQAPQSNSKDGGGSDPAVQQHHPHEVPLAAGRRAAPMQVQQLLSGGAPHRKQLHGQQEYKERE